VHEFEHPLSHALHLFIHRFDGLAALAKGGFRISKDGQSGNVISHGCMVELDPTGNNLAQSGILASIGP